MTPTVAIDDLKVGMFVHLDLGWWAHPFALSSFVITSADQIATIRGLGLTRRLRWSPDKSLILDPTRPDAAAADGVDPGSAAGPDAGQGPPADLVADLVPGAPAPAAPALPAEACAVREQARQAALLAAQRQAEQHCAAQLAEARSSWLQAARCLSQDPGQAMAVADGLARAMLDKLSGAQDLCMRVLSDAGGEPSAAHALNVAVVSLMMGRLCGLSPEQMHHLGLGALLHDVGKLGLPERHRHAGVVPGPDAEQAYQSHVALGLAQGQRMGLPAGALKVLAQHHELADGSGFPQRLGLADMDRGARIVALVNRYDRLCNPRPGQVPMTPHEALSSLFAQCRNQFDGAVLSLFIRMMGVYPPGSLVQLSDERWASVVSVNPARPLKPRVLVCDPAVPADQALLLDLDTQTDLGIRRSVRAAQLPAAARDYLAPQLRMAYFFEPVLAASDTPLEVVAA